MYNEIKTKAYNAARDVTSNDKFCSDFSKIVVFLKQYPNLTARRSDNIADESILKKMAQRMFNDRTKRKPSYPKTAPDKMVAYILQHYYEIKTEEALQIALQNHNQAMAAENIIGTMLEAYIASEAAPLGWIWCSGSIVKAIDFLKPTSEDLLNWQMLQIKNRSNSENSSSAAIRDNTPILKWFRSDARTGNCMWTNFPDAQLSKKLSEEGFKKFIVEYLST